MPHITVEPGVRLYVDDTGGTGRPVVFLHGWPLDSRQWEHQVSALQPSGVRCVAVDNRGFGRSDHAWGRYTYDIFADDLRRVIDALEVDGAALVGLSLGAGTALRYMSRHGGAGVTQLVLCGTPVGAIGELDGPDRLSLLEPLGRLILGDCDEVTRQWLYGMFLAAMPYATLRCLELLRDADLRRDVEALAVPTLILHGGEDRLVPDHDAQALHGAIEHSRLVILERAGHGAFHTARERFNAELGGFLAAGAHPPASRQPINPSGGHL